MPEWIGRFFRIRWSASSPLERSEPKYTGPKMPRRRSRAPVHGAIRPSDCVTRAFDDVALGAGTMRVSVIGLSRSRRMRRPNRSPPWRWGRCRSRMTSPAPRPRRVTVGRWKDRMQRCCRDDLVLASCHDGAPGPGDALARGRRIAPALYRRAGVGRSCRALPAVRRIAGGRRSAPLCQRVGRSGAGATGWPRQGGVSHNRKQAASSGPCAGLRRNAPHPRSAGG